MRSTFALQISNLRAFLSHFSPPRIARFVMVFGTRAAFQKVGIEIRRFFKSVTQVDGPAVRRSVAPIEYLAEPCENVTVSVAIPVKDAGDGFRLLLSSLTTQKGFKKIEIIVVDSGSTDLSVEMAQEFGAKVVRILPQEFSHSYARNLAAEHASGEYILFMVQDALPSSQLWLYELFSALKHNDVVAVSCAEYPREDADLFYRACCWGHYKFLEVDGKDRILTKPESENYFSLRKNAQLSDLACLMPKDLFLRYRFRGNYAEDLELGLRLIKDGHKLAFLSSTRVIHSHNRTPYYHLKRGYVDGLLLCEIFSDCPIAAIEPKRLLQDIIFTWQVVESMAKWLVESAIGSTVADVKKMVVDHYRKSSKECRPEATVALESAHADVAFSAFLNDVHKHYGSKHYRKTNHDGILLYAMRNATNTILEYMDGVYEVADDTLLREFGSSLHKMFAFQCGTHLASCYAKGNDETKRQLETIHRQLSQGV